MTDLVACLGAGKGTWTNVLKLAARPEFEKVHLIVNDWTKSTLRMENPKISLVVIDAEAKASSIRESIISQMKGKMNCFEVAVNLDSGTGKEHTALLTALMRLGLAFRFVVLEDEKIEELSYDLSVPEEDCSKKLTNTNNL
jgi:hypothetical protein